MSFIRKIKIYFKDAYYIIFRHPSAVQLRKQGYEKNRIGAEETAISFNSYVALKKYQRKVRIFFVGTILLVVIISILILVAIILILNLMFSALGIENNPFNLLQIINWLINSFKFW